MFIIKVEKENQQPLYIYHIEDNTYGFTPFKDNALEFKSQQLAMYFITSMPRKYHDITTLVGFRN